MSRAATQGEELQCAVYLGITKGGRFGFGEGAKAEAAPAIDVKVLHAKIGELTLANDFLEGALGKAGLLASARR